MNERYIYLLETKIYTFRSYFNSQAPTAAVLFQDVQNLYGKKKIGTYKFGKSTISLEKMRVIGGFARMLFRVTNPDIPDNRFYSEAKGKLRDAGREGDEEPAISCHVIVNLDSKFDVFQSYPTAMENVPYLSRSNILYTLNGIFGDHFSEERLWTPKSGKPENRIFTPKIRHQAPLSETIGGLLDARGKLKDIEIIEETLQESAPFDKAFPHKERRSIKIIPEKASKPKRAKEIIVGYIKDIDFAKVKKVSVSIEDPDHGKSKVISIDPDKQNVLANAFIPQKLLKKIKPQLTACEDDFHDQLTAKMIKSL